MFVYLVENGLVWTEEGPLDVAVAEADVKDLAVGLWVSIVAVGAAVAREVEVFGDLQEVLGVD